MLNYSEMFGKHRNLNFSFNSLKIAELSAFSTVISILFVAKSDENAFQSRTKQFFWARVGSIGFGFEVRA